MSVSEFGLLLSLFLPLIVFLGVVAIPVAQTATQVILKPISALTPDPNNPRQKIDEEYIERLVSDIKLRGILVPLIIGINDVIVDGFCRFVAAGRAGLTHVPCIQTTQTDPARILGMQLATVMHRAEISAYEKWQACERLRALLGCQQKDLVPHLNLSESQISRIMSPGKLTKAWQDALRDSFVGTGDCAAAAKLATDAEQEALLTLKLSGASRDAIEAAVKKTRKATKNKPEVKLSRFKGQVPGKSVVVQVTGAEFGLSDLIEILTELTKLARAVDTDNQDLSAFQGVLKAKVKAKPKGKEKPGAT